MALQITGTTVVDNSRNITNIANITSTGTVLFTDGEVVRPKFKDYALTINALGSGSGTRTVNLELGNYITATVAGVTTFAFSNPPASAAGGFILELTNGGSSTVNWPASVTKWPGGVAPTLTASGVDVLVFVTDDSGTTWRGIASMLDSK